MNTANLEKPRKTPWLAAAVTAILILGMVFLRITLYPHRIIPLTYSLPLLLALWHRDRVLLWTMAACFAIVASVKDIWLIPEGFFDSRAQQLLFTGMQLLGIVVPTGVLHLFLNYHDRLLRSREALEAANSELEAGNEELAASNEELTAREEEISRQNEELQSQTEELEQQAEELRTQSEELRALNEGLAGREATLQMLLHLSDPATDESHLLEQLCAAGPKLLGEDVAAVAVLERRDGRMSVRAHSEYADLADGEELPPEATLAALAMERSQTAQLEDVRLRPDLRFPKSPSGVIPASIMSAPLFHHGRPIGALEAYANTPRTWTPQQEQLVKWLAGQCSRAWEHLRLREDRKQADELLAESEKRQKVAEAVQAERQRLNAVLDMLPAYVILLSPEHHVPFANRFFEERFGKSEGRRCYEYLFQRSEPCENCESFKALKSGAPHHWEWTGPDGRNYDIHDFPFTDGDGSPLVMEMGLDVTERKRAEAAVKAERQRFLDVLETLPVILALLRPDYGVEWVNRAYRDALGDNVGRLCYASQFGREAPCAECQAFTPLRTGKPHHWEWTLPDDRTFDIYNFPFPDADGAPMILEMDIDITERRRAEAALQEANELLELRVAERTADLWDSKERLQLALQAAGMGWWHWDLDKNVLTVGDRVKDIFGVPDETEPTFELFMALLLPEDNAIVQRQLADLIAQPGDRETEFRIRRPDGDVRWLSANGRPLHADGKTHSIMGVISDITQRKQSEERLAAAKAAAVAANEAKSQFLANMSHELRTPLNAILGMIDVALPKALDATIQDCLQTAKGSADLLLTLLNDLLDSAKIESGKLELESAPFSLRQMLEQVARVLSVRASEKGLIFRSCIAADLPDAVVGDRMRLQQVLLNLAGNAVKFTERGEVEVKVEGRKSTVESQTSDAALHSRLWILEFAVRDTGIGIPRSAIERLFQPFGQADASMSRRFGGTGLGLSICKSLVEMMGGRIWAESEPGKGSTFFFTVRLPLATEPLRKVAPPLAPPANARGQLRILLAEDNRANQKLAAYVLQDRGHLVDIAEDGRQAIALHEKNTYDVILMDVQMPGMDGFEATAAIRKREAEMGLGIGDQESEVRGQGSEVRGRGAEERGLAASAANAGEAESEKWNVESKAESGKPTAELASGQRVENGDWRVESETQRPKTQDQNLQIPSRRTPIIAMTAHAMKGDRQRCLSSGMDGYLSKPIDAGEMIALVERLAADPSST